MGLLSCMCVCVCVCVCVCKHRPFSAGLLTESIFFSKLRLFGSNYVCRFTTETAKEVKIMSSLSCPNLYHVLLKSHSEMCVIEITLQMKGSESNF